MWTKRSSPEPKLMEFGKPVTFSVDIISPTDFDKGRLYVDLLRDISSPIFSLDEDITCSDIMKVPKMQQKCPLEKGERIQYSFTSFPLQQPPLVSSLSDHTRLASRLLPLLIHGFFFPNYWSGKSMIRFER